MSERRRREVAKREKKREREEERRRKIVNLAYLAEHRISVGDLHGKSADFRGRLYCRSAHQAT